MVSPSTNSLGSRGALRLLRRSRPLDSHHDNFDRFIPNRSAMDFDYASFMLTQGQGQGQARNDNAYQQGLAQVFNMNRPRILAFRNLTPTRRGTAAAAQSIFPQPNQTKLLPPPAKPRPVCHTWDRKLDAPDILHDYGLNILDWGRTNNVLAIALANTVYLWNAAKKSTFELVTVSNDQGPVTSLCWAPDGCRLAVGLNDSMVQLWDTAASSPTTPTRTIQGTHTSRVASLAWNHHVLTTGGMDGLVVNHDTRISDDVIQRYRGHTQQVCGLKWSPSGTKLASGGNDNLVHIWDRSSNSPTRWLHRLRQHTDAVKALAWCPFQSNLLATGGGEGDHSIKFWNSQTGACLNSINTASQVSGLLWNRNQRELLSSHGCDLTLWKYPSLAKLAHLTGHTSSILHMTESPDGCTVATAAGDETLMFWNVFGTPALAAKRASKSKPEPFAHVSRIR